MPRLVPRFAIPCRFRGLNLLVTPGQLSPEWLAEAENVELIDGILRPRRGYTKLEAGDLSGVNPVGIVGGFAKIPAASGPPSNESFLVLTISESVDSEARAWFLYQSGTLIKVSYGPTTPAPAAWSWASLMSNTNRPCHVVTGGWTLIAQAATVVKAWAPTGSFSLPTDYANPMRRAGLQAPADVPDLDPPTAGGSLTANATYQYVVTYYDSNSGLESNASPASAASSVTSGGNQTLNVAWLCPDNYYKLGNTSALPTDLFADKVRIYRKMLTPALEDDFTFVTQLDIDEGYSGGVSQWNDTISNSERIISKTPPTRHGVPPGTAFMCEHQGRVIYLPHNTNIFYYSEPTEYDLISGLPRSGGEYVDELSFGELQESGRTTGAHSTGANLLIFQRERAWLADLTPVPDGDPYIHELKGTPGTVSHWTVSSSQATDAKPPRTFWLSTTGVIEFNGSVGRLASREVQPEMNASLLLESGSPWDYSAPLGIVDSLNRRYILFYAKTIVSTRPNLGLIYHFDTDGWTKWSLPTGDAVGDIIILDEGYRSKPVMFTGVYPSSIAFAMLRWHRESVDPYFTDDGTAISWSFKTGDFDLGDPVMKKHVKDVILAFKPHTSGTGSATLSLFRNGSSSALITRTATIGDEFPAYMGVECQRVGIKMAGTMGTANNQTYDWALLGAMANFEPRRIRG